MNTRPRPRRTGRPRPVAPWTRTRLRTAPGASLAFGALVLLTSFLAAAFPRAVEANETRSLREAVTAAEPSRSVLELRLPLPGLVPSSSARENALRPSAVADTYRDVLAAVPAPVRVDRAQSSYGVRTAQPLTGLDHWLPRPEGVPPRFTVAAQAGLAAHATVREGRLPRARAGTTEGTRQIEAAVTTATAGKLRLGVGSVVHVDGATEGRTLALRVTGIVEPRAPEGAYWSAEQLLRTPSIAFTPSRPPLSYWQAGLLVPPAAAPALLGTRGEPEPYWRLAPDPEALTARRLPAFADRIASLESGPGLLRLRDVAGQDAVLTTEMDSILSAHRSQDAAVTPVLTVAATGTAVVAAVTLAMTAGLTAARRGAELALLRARGGSLGGIAGRLLAESAAVALPADAAGLTAAVLLVGEAALAPAIAAAAAVTVFACAALPVRAIVAHRGVRAEHERADLIRTRPGRRRTVAELTLLVPAVASVTALRLRGTTGDGDLLAGAAPVLAALVAALVLARLYPLPLRPLVRWSARLRGAVGFLSLARAGRGSPAGPLSVLVLLVALTTASFGGAVLTGVADARDRAALTATGADTRVSGAGGTTVLPDGVERAVRDVPGVRAVAPVMIDSIDLSAESSAGDRLSPALIAVDPPSYARFLHEQGLGGFPVRIPRAGGERDDDGAVVDAVASPGVAAALGRAPRRTASPAGTFTVRVTEVLTRTPVLPTSASEFLLVDASALPRRATNTLLVSGPDADPEALRKAARTGGGQVEVRLRSEERAAYADPPLQSGAELLFGAAVLASSGFAALALLMSFLTTAPERTALLARLRTMGLTRRQGRRLLLLETLPQTLPAAVGGVLAGWATVWLLGPGLDLTPLAFAAAGSGPVPQVEASLRTDPWSLLVPAAGVVALTAAVAAAQAWWVARAGSITELRAGDAP
ncbi:FtsX-like permease family protein [Streptomyces poonensis]|uniref:Membrane protein n=1 Tax=Streptomyces poonensis TaxID=68255 RepID=A0A918PB13_9ACTN|nr:FtsX-like permease family protein [Streptomyces poonensis]GGY97149.1 membrane protein [Streptomyces poonensis]